MYTNTGVPLIECEYGSVTGNYYWIIGFKYEECTEKEGDKMFYELGDNGEDLYGRIVSADVYRRNGDTTVLMQSFSGEDVCAAELYKSYLILIDRDHNADLYNENQEIVAENVFGYYTDVFSFIYNNTEELPDIAYTQIEKDGKLGISDADGNVLITPQYLSVYYPVGDYVRVTEDNHLSGLVSLEDEIIVPAQYDTIMLASTDKEWTTYDSGGYVGVMKDNLIGWYDIEGNIVSEPYCPADEVEYEGASAWLDDKENNFFHIYAADGIETEIPYGDDKKEPEVLKNTLGRLYFYKTPDNTTVTITDFHGKPLFNVDGPKNPAPKASGSGKYILIKSDDESYDLYEIIYDEP